MHRLYLLGVIVSSFKKEEIGGDLLSRPRGQYHRRWWA